MILSSTVLLFTTAIRVIVRITCSSSSSAGKVKDNKDVAQPLKDFGLRISKLLVRVRLEFMGSFGVAFQDLNVS